MAETSEFSKTLDRLEEIVREVEADDVTLDDALALYEEAVKLSLAACDLSELDVLADEAAEEPATEVAEAEAEGTAEAVAEVAGDGIAETSVEAAESAELTAATEPESIEDASEGLDR